MSIVFVPLTNLDIKRMADAHGVDPKAARKAAYAQNKSGKKDGAPKKARKQSARVMKNDGTGTDRVSKFKTKKSKARKK